MNAYVVAFTPKRAIILLLCTAGFLLSAGLTLIFSSYGAQYCELRYHAEPGHTEVLEFSAANCSHLVTPLTGSFALYYKLDGYYQNHKEFRRSIDYNQLFGNIVDDVTSINTCRPYTEDEDGRILHPCGAVPRAVFADRFTVFRDAVRFDEIELDESRASICNKRGVHTLFNNPTAEEMNTYNDRFNFWMQDREVRRNLNMDKAGVGEGVLNSHFINWVDIASTSTVQKLYGIFDTNNVALPIYVNVEVSTGLPRVVKKSVVIAKRSVLGNTGHIMGVIYVIVSLIITLLAAIAFAHVRNTKEVMSH